MIEIPQGAITNTVSRALTWGRSVRVEMIDGRKFTLVPRGAVEREDITRIARAINDGVERQTATEHAIEPPSQPAPQVRAVGLSRGEARKAAAASMLIHYFRQAYEAAGIRLDSDNEAEISGIVDDIVDAAREGV
jgi:hypothetical protein